MFPFRLRFNFPIFIELIQGGTLNTSPLFFTSLLVLSACSYAPVGGGACVTAVASAKTLRDRNAVKRQYKLPEAIPGGTLEMTVSEEFQSQPMKTIQCTVFVTFPARENAQAILWTAQHCFRPAQTGSVTLVLDQGRARIPVAIPELTAAQKISNQLRITDPNLAREVRQILQHGESTHAAVTGDTLKACIGKKSGETSACFTVADMASIKVTLEAQPGTTTALTQLRAQHDAFFQNKSDKEKVQIYHEGVRGIMSQRQITGILSLLTSLSKCTSKKVSCNASYEKEGLAFAQRFLSPTGYDEHPMLRESSTPVDLVQAKAAWTKLVANIIKDYRAKLDPMWEEFDNPALRARTPLLFATRVNDGGKDSFMWLPASTAKVEPSVPAQKDVYSEMGGKGALLRTFIFRSPLAAGSSVEFHFGDSGSVLLIGRIPIATMSHKDGEETSGGASVVALPTRKKEQQQAPVIQDVGGKKYTIPTSMQSPKKEERTSRETTTNGQTNPPPVARGAEDIDVGSKSQGMVTSSTASGQSTASSEDSGTLAEQEYSSTDDESTLQAGVAETSDGCAR
jgi:hypothetical protein